MKLNGKLNIITDADITLTNTNHAGESLQTVLEDTDKRIDKLESNVKWIYENGGVGSGSGGSGGGGSDRWTLKATLNGVALQSNQQLPLSGGAGNYQLRIYTSGGSGSYSVSYSYGGGTPKRVVLGPDNGWSMITSVTLMENGILEIIATDGVVTREITGVSYIVIPYVFSAPKLYDRSGKEYSSASKDIFVEIARQSGIIMKSSYVIAAESKFWYTWYFNGEAQGEPTEILNKDGTLEFQIDDSFFINDNAGLYSYQLVITVLPPTSTESYDFVQSDSFNLIPDNLYLKISPANNNEAIYNNSDIANPFVFSTNTSIALNARIYDGLTASGLSGKITWTVNDDENYVGNGTLNVQDGLTYTITTYFSNVGWNKVVFTYTLGTKVGTPITKWFYCKEVSTSYDWFFKVNGSENTPVTRRYYIPQALVSENKLHGITGVDSSALYIEKKKSNDNPTVLNILKDVPGDITYTRGDQMFNFGIQYNEINNVDLPIIICYDSVGDEAIKIYQNKIVFGGAFSSSELSCNIFLHKEDHYDVSDRTKYHLLTINCATCYYDSTKAYYELTAYVDGKIEGTVNTKPFSSAIIERVALQQSNFALNHLEISSWGEITDRRVFDVDVNWYYNSYSSRIGNVIPDSETLILETLFDTRNLITTPNYSVENRLVKVNAGLPNTVASNTTVPVLVLTCSKDIYYGGDIYTIYDWMNGSYRDGEKTLNTATFEVSKLEWAPGGENSVLAEIAQPKDENENILGQFILDLQGSSTMTYKSKNFTLGIRSSEYVTNQNKQTLFSPNFNSNDEGTFLPENSFTLKADVVDSSHTNNTAVGKFVNDNNNWDYRSMIDLNGVQQQIRTHIKQCLEGFATLVFLNVAWRDESNIDHVDCYYLGVYNFNLGRGSYFNLGYSDLTQLDYEELDTSANSNHGFAFCTANITPKRGFVAAEVQENSPFYDFSQYDNSILFPLPNSNETAGFMFGDIVASSNTENIEQSIQQFVKSVAGGGGFLFDLIGKRKVPANVSDTNKRAYKSYDIEIDQETGKEKIYTYVNDYAIQYIRSLNGQVSEWRATQGDLQNLTAQYLEECVIGDVEQGRNPKLDYASIVYYYVTCMVLGLTDSVQKNLNIKTWNASDAYPTMGAFFYDMDTCLGKNNAGTKTSYFAFSDYWKSNIDRYDANGQLIPEDDKITPVARVVNKGITNFRDTFLENSGVSGYDIPSSYLFAIAKYGYLMDFVRSKYPEVFPQNIYAYWRRANGVMSSADKFIDVYFASNLNNVPACLINLNYRNKYLYDYKESDSSFAATHMLHGTGVEETRDWLKGRLRILDAYFNVVGATTQIYGNYYEPIRTYTVSTNPDVNVYRDIFTNASTTYVSRKPPYMVFNITAPDYSPLVVRQGSNYIWYLFEDSNTEYETYVPIDGVQITVFGGSQMWRTLDSINAFVETREDTDSDFIFNTSILTTMSGDSGTQSGNWDIVGPSLETISLTGTKYSGTLAINDDFYSIKNIDISNSKISLEITQDCPVKNIIANNLGGANSFRVSNCKSLESISLDRANIGICRIDPTWTDNLDFSYVYAKSLTLEAKQSGNLTISNNSAINSLTFSKMQNVNVTNCSGLISVTCVDTDSAPLKNLNITKCPSLTTLNIKADSLEVLNLTGCTSLQEITLRGDDFSNLRILGLGNTQVSKITIGDTVCENGVFDFTKFPKLAKADTSYSGTPYVSFYNNKQVVSIQFDNSGDTILWTDPNVNSACFTNCDNLERLYGSFLIQTINCFKSDVKFSVHGSDLTNVTWNGQSVLDNGRCKHPSEWGISSSTDYWPRTLGITNMRFDGNYADSSFWGTNYTLFDVYYLLYGCDDRVKSLNNTFYSGYNVNYGRFKWDESVDNSPNVHMFDNCSGVTDINTMFWGNGNNTIRLFSPSNNGEIVTEDNGLFSPLVNLTSYYLTFGSYVMYADRFVFQRSSGSYNINTLCGFSPKYIIDDVNTYSYNTRPSVGIEHYGNLTGFFKNLPYLKDRLLGIFDQTEMLDFSTIAGTNSKIPNAVTTVGASFTSKYGTGEISLASYFDVGTKLQNIHHSFITSDVLNEDVYPTMRLTNSTFALFVPRPSDNYLGLIEIGYKTEGYISLVRSEGNCLGSSFSGVIYKDFGSDFPFNIFKNLPNLTMAAGVFMNAHGDVSGLKLPGNLFENNTLLNNCAAEFYNLNNPYEISETYDITYDLSGSSPKAVISKDSGYANFVNCYKLSNVSYMFGGPAGTSSSDSIPSLSGQIPRKLFWHGLNENATKTNVIKGTNTRTEIIDPQTGDPTGEYNYGQLMTANQYIIAPNATIETMNNCFQHSNCEAYYEEELLYEPNPNYSPFLYLTNDDGETFYVNRNRDERQYTSEWFYDGYTNHSTIRNNANVVLLDTLDWDATYNNDEQVYQPNTSDWLQISAGQYEDVKPQVRERYMCAPDLLRYCNEKANISGLFAYSGSYALNTVYYVVEALKNVGGKYAYGILGRICPYLLKPVPKVSNVDGMFEACKRLTYIHNRETNKDYLLPLDFFTYATEITSLKEMFKWTVQPPKVDMRGCFDPLKRNNLNIIGIFSCCYWQGTQEHPTYIDSVFVNNNIATLDGAFRMEGSLSSGYPYDQDIQFNNVFNSKYTSKTYATDPNFANAFRGWNTGHVIHENPKTLPDNTQTNNYTFVQA